MEYVKDTDYYDPIKAQEDDIRIARSNETMWSEAITFTKEVLGPVKLTIESLYIDNPDSWWVPYHFYNFMTFRNELRQNGFGERDFNIQNLDNIYVPLIEEALGLKEI